MEVSGRNSIFSVQLYELIRSKVDADTAAKAVQAVEGIIEIKPTQLATKEDIAKLETKIVQTESKLILWAFVFWATQLGAMFGLLYFFLKK